MEYIIYWGGIRIGVHYLLVNAVGFVISVGIGYILNNCFAFKEEGESTRWSLSALYKMYVSYFFLGWY